MTPIPIPRKTPKKKNKGETSGINLIIADVKVKVKDKVRNNFQENLIGDSNFSLINFPLDFFRFKYNKMKKKAYNIQITICEPISGRASGLKKIPVIIYNIIVSDRRMKNCF